MSGHEINKYFDQLPGRGLISCFNGLLRRFCLDDRVWTSEWTLRSCLQFDWSEVITYDFFGNVYGVDRCNQVYIMSLDSGDVSGLDVDIEEFFKAIEVDPVSTIRSGLYEEAKSKLGKISKFQNYDIARQIKGLPLGARLKIGG